MIYENINFKLVNQYIKKDIFKHCRVLLERSALVGINFYNCNFGYIEDDNQFYNCHFHECIFNKCAINNTKFIECVFIKCSFINSKIRESELKYSKFKFCRFDFSIGFIELVESSTNCTYFGAK